MKTIYLSPENRKAPHGPYAYGNTFEHDVCQAIGEYEKAALERCGFAVILAAEDTTMVQRVNEANRLWVNLYQTIHTNAGGGTGAEVYYYDHPSSIRACQDVYDELIKIYPSKRGLKDGSNFYENKYTKMVSVYPEIAFHDNEKDAKFLVEHKEEIAEAMTKGICKYFDVPYVEKEDTTDYKKLYEEEKERYETLVKNIRSLID